MWYYSVLGIVTIALVSCQSSGAPVAPPVNTIIPISGTAPTTLVASTPFPVATLTLPTILTLEAGGRYVQWEGFLIPLPTGAQLLKRDPLPSLDHTNSVPVIAAATVAFPPSPTPEDGAIGEYPAPPELTLLRFSGTIAEWIELEQANPASQAGNTVTQITAMTVAEREAIHYQRSVPGFNFNDYYVLKPTEDTLLWILTDAGSYQMMIEKLVIDTP